MFKIQRFAIVNHSVGRMYKLVNKVENYPKFIPMCYKVEVFYKNQNRMEAILFIKKAGIKISFGTLNELFLNKKITMQLIKGPFSSFKGLWNFKKIEKNSCEVSLYLEFDFSNNIFSLLLKEMLDEISSILLKSFCLRADYLYKKMIQDEESNVA